MFYQGVCGSSTQVFWLALVDPFLYTLERAPHSQFYKNFYGQMGTDAAIYENYKKLLVENMANHEIYF